MKGERLNNTQKEIVAKDLKRLKGLKEDETKGRKSWWEKERR